MTRRNLWEDRYKAIDCKIFIYKLNYFMTLIESDILCNMVEERSTCDNHYRTKCLGGWWYANDHEEHSLCLENTGNWYLRI